MSNTFDPDLLRFVGTTDKDAVSYAIGEPMTFTFSMDYKGDKADLPMLFARWTRAGDDGAFDSGMQRIEPGKTVSFTTSLDRPGFVHIYADLVTADGKTYTRKLENGTVWPLNFDGGAGAAVDQILPVAEEPADFDEFWALQRRILDVIPLKVRTFPVPEDHIAENCRGKLKVSIVYVDCAGTRPVTGYLYELAGAAPKSMPARCMFHGYGCEDFSNVRFGENELNLAKSAVTYNVNAHGYELDRETAYYTEMNVKLNLYGLSKEENKDPNTAYFRGMAFRVMRAFDYIKTHPLWNGKDLFAAGGSQGGLQTVWAGSLVKGLTLCRPEVTWCSDMAGKNAGRLSGWCPEYVSGLGYFETAFHSRRIPDTCLLEVTRFGLGDYCCPPSGTAAHFNSANCPKKLRWVQNSQHGTVPPADELEEFRREFPAGCGINGKAPEVKVTPRPAVKFVPAHFEHGKWQLFREDGTKVEGFTFNGDHISLRNGRAADGSDLKLESSVTLTGTLVAEADGYALIGTGIDWWWQVLINGVPAFGRTRSAGCNDVGTFDKTDWIFRAPVHKGENKVVVEVVLGQYGTASIDVLPDEFAAKEIPQRIADQYVRMQEAYVAPSPEPEYSLNGKTLKFKSSQASPAGVMYREAGTEDWSYAWSSENATEHDVTLTVQNGKTYEAKIIQHAYLCNWTIAHSNPFELKF